ncbi:LytTR family transcriptional regulator [Rhodocytophaga rosea]|uniref:LytTR family transcriptional regulator n=1 Tax=Rhodocytophaga rosea TaxID=2704465 RepID=A0A6C0GFP6_9BACT|nr:LytTR family DNA-binding domain-containing protein [Rhodocytophaga rosea]QHT66777.1 LytTR family transcriptional regulator [Rhodocytophaga rosea]
MAIYTFRLKQLTEKSPYHPDVPLFLVLIPCISAFNYYLTYSKIAFNWYLLLTFTIDTVQGYLAWLGARAVILYLDKKFPYENNPAQRILIQIASTCVISLSIISILTELVSWIVRGRPALLNFYTNDLFIISIWFLVINGIYIGLYYYRQLQKSEDQRKEESRIIAQGFSVKVGKQNIWLNFDDLTGFYVDENYVMASHKQGQKYCLEQSLDKLEKTLPTTFFFRLNRQFIIHRQIISGFKRSDNGKILVLLNGGESFPAEVPVSRTKAPAFKTWFEPA